MPAVALPGGSILDRTRRLHAAVNGYVLAEAPSPSSEAALPPSEPPDDDDDAGSPVTSHSSVPTSPITSPSCSPTVSPSVPSVYIAAEGSNPVQWQAPKPERPDQTIVPASSSTATLAPGSALRRQPTMALDMVEIVVRQDGPSHLHLSPSARSPSMTQPPSRTASSLSFCPVPPSALAAHMLDVKRTESGVLRANYKAKSTASTPVALDSEHLGWPDDRGVCSLPLSRRGSDMSESEAPCHGAAGRRTDPHTPLCNDVWQKKVSFSTDVSSDSDPRAPHQPPRQHPDASDPRRIAARVLGLSSSPPGSPSSSSRGQRDRGNRTSTGGNFPARVQQAHRDFATQPGVDALRLQAAILAEQHLRTLHSRSAQPRHSLPPHSPVPYQDAPRHRHSEPNAHASRHVHSPPSGAMSSNNNPSSPRLQVPRAAYSASPSPAAVPHSASIQSGQSVSRSDSPTSPRSVQYASTSSKDAIHRDRSGASIQSAPADLEANKLTSSYPRSILRPNRSRDDAAGSQSGSQSGSVGSAQGAYNNRRGAPLDRAPSDIYEDDSFDDYDADYDCDNNDDGCPLLQGEVWFSVGTRVPPKTWKLAHITLLGRPRPHTLILKKMRRKALSILGALVGIKADSELEKKVIFLDDLKLCVLDRDEPSEKWSVMVRTGKKSDDVYVLGWVEHATRQQWISAFAGKL